MNKYKLAVVLCAGILFALPVKAFTGKVLGTSVATSAVETGEMDMITPAYNANWNIGSTYDITWTSTNVTGNVSILIASDSESNPVAGYLVKSITNTGKYSWTIGENLLPYDNLFGDTSGLVISSKLVAGKYYILVVNNAKDSIGYTESFNIIRPNVPSPTVTFKANDTKSLSVDKTAVITLSWVSTNAQYCDGYSYTHDIKTSDNLDWATIKNLPANGSRVVTTTSTYSMYPEINCYNSYGDMATDYASVYFKSPTTVPPVPSGPNLVLSDTFVDYNYEIGLPVPEAITAHIFNQSTTQTANFKISALDQPAWLNSGYSADILTLGPGQSMGLGVSVDPTKVSVGTYTYSIRLIGDFANSPIELPITLKVSNKVVDLKRLPIGNFESVDGGSVRGWAADQDTLDKSVSVHLYFDGPAGKGKLVSNYPAFEFRQDVDQVLHVGLNRGFNVAIPDLYKDGKSHTVYAYAIDSADSSKHSLLNGSPKTFTYVAKPNSVRDGALYKDGSAIFVIENGVKRPFISMEVLQKLNYNLKNVKTADTSDIPLGTPVVTSDARHPRGTLVNSNGVIYFMGSDARYAYPSKDVFYSWGNDFPLVVPANSFDLAVPEGATADLYSKSATAKQNDAIRLANVRMIMTALELYYNDCGGYPNDLKYLSTGQTKYVVKVPQNPWPAGYAPFNYIALGSPTNACGTYNYDNYSLDFNLDTAIGSYTAGYHVASYEGIK